MPEWWNLVDMLGLGSSSEKSKGSSPFFGNFYMPTYNQLCKNKRIQRKKRKKTPALEACPQKKGICTKLVLRTPKKPNSALRKLAKLKLSNQKEYTHTFLVKGNITYKNILMCLFEEAGWKIYQE